MVGIKNQISQAASFRPLLELVDSIVDKEGGAYVVYGDSSLNALDHIKTGNKKFDAFTELSDMDILIVTKDGPRTPDSIYHEMIYENIPETKRNSPIEIIDNTSYQTGITFPNSNGSRKDHYNEGFWNPKRISSETIESKHTELTKFEKRIQEIRTYALNLEPHSLTARELKRLVKTTRRAYGNLNYLRYGIFEEVGGQVSEESGNAQDVAVLYVVEKGIEQLENKVAFDSSQELVNYVLYLKNLAEDALCYFYDNINEINEFWKKQGVSLYQRLEPQTNETILNLDMNIETERLPESIDERASKYVSLDV
ncbi:MAG: hypothetical protein GOU98_00115 [Candidatus Altiarchaeota archaeon]|nr:hypothetical protein [Candidatus Altiarchaeota archaeon]